MEWKRELSQDPPSYWMPILISALIAISYGVGFGHYDNHPVYLIRGLRLYDPGFLAYDWWASQSTHYHRNFAYIVAGLRYLNILPWGLAILKIIGMSLFGWMLFIIINALTSLRAIWVWLLAVLVFFVIYNSMSVAGSVLFSVSSQPQTISTVFFMGAVTAFILGRHALSGLLLGGMGLFHTNFLLLSFPFFGIALLIIGWPLTRKDWWLLIKRGMWQFLPALLILAFEIPNIINVMGIDLPAAQRAEASRLVIDFNGPYHYKPMTNLLEFLVLGGWTLMGLALLPGLAFENDAGRRFSSLFYSGIGMVSIATLLTTVVFLEPVSRLYVWRLAPYLLLMALIIVMAAVLRPFMDPDTGKAPRHWQMGLASAGFSLVILKHGIQYGLFTKDWRLLLSICAIAILALWALQAWARSTTMLHALFMRWRRIALPFFVIILLGLAGITANPANFNLLFPMKGEENRNALFEWARGTEPDSVFLTPPNMGAFRLFAERAIVIDWKAIPFRPDETLEWYKRIQAINGGKGSLDSVTGYDLARDDKYNAMTRQTLDAIIKDYGVRYVVFSKNTPASKLATNHHIVYENSGYIVFIP